MATALWMWGVGILIGGTGLGWLAPPGREGFPDPAWGGVPERDAWAVAAAVILGGALASASWYLRRIRRQPTDPSRTRHVVTAVRALILVMCGLGLAAVARACAQSVSLQWSVFPGWASMGVLGIAAAAGAVVLPSRESTRRRASPESSVRHPRMLAALIGCVLVLAPILAVRGMDATQTTLRVDTSARRADATPTAAGETSPVRGVVVGGSTDTGTSWSRRWRGAADPQVIPAHVDDTTAVVMRQATVSRPRLVLLDAATGRDVATLDQSAAEDLGIDLDAGASAPLATYGQVLVAAGEAQEWLRRDTSQRLDGPPQRLQDAAMVQVRRPLGVHARNLVTGSTWFVGDDGVCERRLATDGDGQWIATQDVLVLIQACHLQSSPEDNPQWAVPAGRAPELRANSLTLIGLDPQDGSLRWQAEDPSWARWAGTADALPSLSSGLVPLEMSLDADARAAMVVLDGHRSAVDLASGNITSHTGPQ